MPKYLCVDFETTTDESRSLICGVFYEPGSPPYILDRADTIFRCTRALLDGETVFVLHNGAFDLKVLLDAAPYLTTKIFQLFADARVRDTQVRQQLLDVRDGIASDSTDTDDDDSFRVVFRQKNGLFYKSGISLADLEFHYDIADRREEKKDPNSPRMRFAEVAGLPVSAYPPEFTKYALEDATGTWQVFQKQGGDALPNEVEQVESAFDLYLIERRGMGVQEERVLALKEKATAEYEKIKLSMADRGFYKKAGAMDHRTLKPTPTGKTRIPRPWAPSEVGKKDQKVITAAVQAAYDKLKLPPPRTKKGAVSCDKDSLKNSGDPLLVELSGAGPLGSVVNTFLPLLEAGIKGRIHTKFNNLLATGRISSAKPNLNNIPRGGGVRECIVPPPGYVLLSCDYDCAELRSHAQVNYQLGLKPEMREFFLRQPNGDPHAELAASILKISAEEAAARKAAEEPEFVEARQASKALNFGLPGGMGAERLMIAAKRQYGVSMTLAEAKKRKQQWLRRWPEMRRYFDFITHHSDRFDHITQLAPASHGPHRVRGRGQSARWFSQCANTLFQGLTADGAKRALALVTRACYDPLLQSPLYGSYVVAFLYDELILEVPEGKAHECAMELEHLMVQGMQEWVRDVPITAGPKLMRSWSKRAKATWQEGRLVAYGD